MADGITDAADAPAVHKAGEKGGASVAKDVEKGVADENRRRNPFRSMLDAFKRLSFDNVFRGVDIDLPELDISSREILGDAEDGGEEVGDAVTRGIEKSHKKKNPFDSLAKAFKNLDVGGPIGWLALFGPATLAPVIGTVIAALALVTQALGFIVLAAAGAGVALAGIAAVALPGLGVLFAAFKTETKQLKRFKEEAKKLLAPWKEIGASTQKLLLPGLERALKLIQHLVPTISEFGEELGGIVGKWAEYAAVVVTSEKNMGALSTILGNSTQFFDLLGEAAIRFIDALLPFFAAAAPLAVRFGESLVAMATSFQAMFDTTEEADALGDTFSGWYDIFSTLASIIGNVFDILWSVLSIAGETGTPFFDKIDGFLDRWATFLNTPEGENKIRTFFENAQPVIDELFRLLGNVIDLIVKPTTGDGGALMFERLAFALDILNDVLENPLTAQIVPYLLGLIVALKLLALLATPIDAIGKAFGLLSSALSGLAQVLGFAGQAIYGGFSLIARGLLLLAGGFGAVIQGLVSLSIALVTTPVGLIILGIAAAIGILVAAFIFWDEIIAALKAAWEWFTELSGVMKVVIAIAARLLIFNVVTGPIIAFGAAILGIVAIIKNWDAVVATFVNFFTDLPENLAAAAAAVSEFVTGLPDLIAGLASSIGDTLSNLPTQIKDAILGGLEDLPGLILDGIAGLFEIGQNMLGLITSGLAAALPALFQFFVELPTRVMTLLGRAFLGLLEVGVQIIGFIVTGLARALPEIFFFFLRLPVEIATILRNVAVSMVKFGIEMIVALVKGVVSERGRILDFFKALPGNILSAAITAVTFLFNLGRDIIAAVINGVINNAGRLFDFFTELPGRILGLIGDVASILVTAGGNLITGFLNGATAFLGSLDEFFYGLPGRIVGIVGDLFGVLWAGVSAGADAFLANISGWVVGIVDFFIALPGNILGAIGDIGGAIWGFVSGGFASTAASIAGWIADRLTDFAGFVTDLPGKLIDFGANLLSNIASGLAAAIPAITTWITDRLTDFADFVADMPNKFLDFGTNLMRNLATGLAQGATAVGTWVTDRLDDIAQFVLDIPGKLWNLGTTLASSIGAALKRAWNTAVSLLPSLSTEDIPGYPSFFPDVTFSADFLKFAMGGIIPGSALGMPLIAGEGNRAEAIVPMTRPSQALTIMQEAGLDRLVLDAYFHGKVPTQTGLAGEVTMLHIDKATIVAPVDAEMLAQKVTAAYTRMAS